MLLPLKASTTSKDGTKLGETHDDIHIVGLDIFIFCCGHGV
jgi:hypothetical protein